MRRAIVFLAVFSLSNIVAAQQVQDATSSETRSETITAPEAIPASSPLTANTVYMCEFKSNSQLFKVNTSTAAISVVGSMQLNQTCTDLAFRKTAASGTELFGTSFTRLFKISPTTGKATLVSNAYGSGFTDINALVAQPGSGRLYGAGNRAPGQFVEISPTTGKATRRGSYGAGLSSAGDLAFLNGQLYGLLYKNGNGTKTFLAKISLASSTMGHATALVPIRRSINGKLVQQLDVWGLVVRNGVMLAATRTGEILRINPSNGTATLVGDNNRVQAGLALSP